jgi:hypothetical protein
MPKKAPPMDAATPEIVERAERCVREALAVSPRKLTDAKLTRAAQAELAEALGRRGLEHTGKHVRVPLAEQLALLLARDGSVAVAALRRAIRGATGAPELKALVENALRRGDALLVLRDGKEHLVPPDAAALSSDELDALVTAAAALAKLRRKLGTRAFGARPTLLANDVQRLFQFARPAAPLDAIVEELRRAITPAQPFAYLPDLARRAGVADPTAFTARMEKLARAGRIELRPESGLGLLGADDAAFCPRAPDGAILSYARPTGVV